MKKSFKEFWIAINMPQGKKPLDWFDLISIIFMVVTTILFFLRMLGVFDSPASEPLSPDYFYFE